MPISDSVWNAIKAGDWVEVDSSAIPAGVFKVTRISATGIELQGDQAFSLGRPHVNMITKVPADYTLTVMSTSRPGAALGRVSVPKSKFDQCKPGSVFDATYPDIQDPRFTHRVTNMPIVRVEKDPNQPKNKLAYVQD